MPKFFTKETTPEEHHFENPTPNPEYFTPKISEGGEIKTLLTWEAHDRPFRKKNRSYYTTIAIIVVLLTLIALLAQEFLLIGVLLALTFVSYILAFVPPRSVTYQISTQGITIGEHFYFWHYLDSFWLKNKNGQKVIYVQTRLMFPGQLMLVLSDVSEDEIKNLMARFLPFLEKPQLSLIDKWAESLQKHFPLENTNH